jgi:hypothetical protein
MTRKKTSKKKSTKRDPERIERNKKIALGTAISIGAAGVFVGGAFGVGELDRRAAEFVVPGHAQVIINWPTNSQGKGWMPINERERIALLLSRSVQGGKALSRAPLEEAGLALMRTGWIQGTPTVTWTSEGQISLESTWRVPVAVVREGSREYLIDQDPKVLPLDYAIGESNQFFFVNADAHLPEVGEQWLGTDLQDGLELLQILTQEGLLEQIAGFDLGKDAESGTIRILTRNDGRIIWGAGPGRERPGEVPTSVKIERLNAVFNRTGLIDGGSEFIDIRGSDILFQRREG